MNGYNSTIILFGSMADFLAAPFEASVPRDIDVAFEGCSAADAEAFVRAWLAPQIATIEAHFEAAIAANAAELDSVRVRRDELGEWDFHKGHEWMQAAFALDERMRELYAPTHRLQSLRMCTSVDAHRVHARNGVVTLTVPARATGSAVAVLGYDVSVEWVTVESLPGIIRTEHDRPDVCAELILRYLDRVGGQWGGIHREFRFLPYDGHDHDCYTRDGITAVRNARAHCTPVEWSAIVAGIGDFGPVLEAMSVSKGLSEDFRVNHKGAACAGGDGVLCLDWPGRTFFYPYGGPADWGFTFEQIIAAL